ncbi:non-ribosomal peptide synthetase modules [Ectocarpus siliculosus]|uniref:Non-ribosomal peptide synthetase modules n=1 Tax=Ectocarpus siliculosus TaxID=2880 RepID=D7FLB8_ECTSI|nr:non-ribosomal peptide synthetase modules [Ectocarpus siliculosus]|eukprot:CBJ29686.1 non-ribosomal peptide synthetase modules [Ectocarpus siliculosus]
MLYGLCLCLLVAASKWLLVGRVRPGETFNTHSVRHLLWWTIQRLQSFSGLLFVDEIRRGRLVVWYYRLLGAKLGRDVFLNTVRISDPDLVTVGDGSTINEHADLSGHQIVGNRVVFGSGVTIGSGTVLLPSAYMAPEAHVGNGRVVGALATAAHPTRRNSTPLAPPTPFTGVFLQVLADLVSLYFVAVAVGLAAFVGFRSFSFMLEMANVFPGERMSALGYGPLSGSTMAFACYAAVFLLNRLYLPVLLVFGGADVAVAYSFLTDTVLRDVGLPRVLALAAVSAVVFHVTHMVLSVILKWVLVQRFSQVEGVCCTTSWLGFRKQITDRLIMSAMMRSVLMFNGNLGNSLWLMALGGPVGRCVSVMLNKNIYTEPELLTLGDDMHVGFASSTYCSIYTAPNSFTLRKTFIGDRGLNGAGSVTLPGATLPHGAALGPNTRLGPSDEVREGALHLGSPAPVVAGRYASPPRELSRLERWLYLLAPLPLAAASTAITLSAAFWPLLALARAAEALGGPGVACLLTPLAWLGLGVSLAVTGAVGKWTIIGKQHPSDTKLWSVYHYRTLLVLYLQIHAHFLFVDILRRGKMFNCYARLLGASVGRDADVATMYFTDHDLVSIGDRAVVQEDCIPHPQFYFEGTMSFKPVTVGAGGNAGARSILLGGGTVKPGGSLDTLGLAAKASGMRGGEGRAAPEPEKRKSRAA